MWLVLMIVGLLVVLLGPLTYIITKSVRAGMALTKRTQRLLRTGRSEPGRILTVGRSPVEAAYDGGTMLMRFTVRVSGGDVIIDQTIPRVAVGGLHPGTDVQVRIDPGDRQSAVIDLFAMGYR